MQRARKKKLQLASDLRHDIHVLV